MSTDLLLFLGPVTAVLFVLVVTVGGARRRGYDAGYHTGSGLELGKRGWVRKKLARWTPCPRTLSEPEIRRREP